MVDLKTYLVALAVGVFVGVIYGLLNVRSPAPPVVALVGLLGILVGEQVVPIAKRLLAPGPVNLSAIRADCTRHLFGAMPGVGLGAEPPPPSTPSVSEHSA